MKLCLLGASGSIGSQTLEVIEGDSNFELVSFSVGHRHEVIEEIIAKHKEVTHVYLIDKEKCEELSKKYPDIEFLCGEHDLEDIITKSNPDMVVNALIGFAGLLPSIRALKQNKKLALANKESLVVGGEIINKLLKKGHGKLYPIDSEHSAIWKCLKADKRKPKKIIITGSGGSFRHLTRNQLVGVNKADALEHPTWKMGEKITIDSATMMNKGFELIEAYYLFGYGYDDIVVKLHDESMMHSAVQYKDGTYRAEINSPDMKNPIKFALFEGKSEFETQAFKDFDELKHLHFRNFNPIRYPLVPLAHTVLEMKGNMGAIVNSANEVAVRAFLDEKIPFLNIEDIIFETIKLVPYKKKCTLEDIIKANDDAREVAQMLVEGIK